MKYIQFIVTVFKERIVPLKGTGYAVKLVWKSSPGWTIASTFLLLIQGVIPLLGLLLLKELVDSVTAAIAATDLSGALDQALIYVALIGIVMLVGALLESLSTLVNEAQSHQLTDYVQGLIHEKSVALDLAYFETAEYYDNLHRAQREGVYRPTRIVNGLTSLSRNSISLTGVAGLLLFFNPWIVIIVFAAALPSLFVKLKYSNELFRWRMGRTATERKALMIDRMLTDLQFAKELRLFGLGHFLKQRFTEMRNTLRFEKIAMAKRRSMANFAAQASGTLAVIGFLAYIIVCVGRKTISLGDMVMYYQALQRCLTYMQQILVNLAGLYEDNLFLSNLNDFLNQKPLIVDIPNPTPVPEKMNEGIVFNKVSFHYPGCDDNVLNNIDLAIRPGEIIALVGENGAGKTTLVKLLCRLYDPDSGHINFERTDLKSYSVTELRDQIGIIFQDFAHFPATVSENVGFGNIKRFSGKNSIEEAARWAGIDHDIEKLPQGYETILGKWFRQGQELSIGQWQKIALARAYYSNAQIMIFDEPTSSLDAKAERRIFEQLRVLMKGRTTLLISHRFSSVRVADRIYVLENGCVVENGTHHELMDLDGLYARMFNAQASMYL